MLSLLPQIFPRQLHGRRRRKITGFRRLLTNMATPTTMSTPDRLVGKRPTLKGIITQPARNLLKSLSSKSVAESSTVGAEEDVSEGQSLVNSEPEENEVKAAGDEAETPVAGTFRDAFNEDNGDAEKNEGEQLPVAAVGREVPVATASNVRVADPVMDDTPAQEQPPQNVLRLYYEQRLVPLLKPLIGFVLLLLVVSLYVGDVAWSPLKLGRNFREAILKETQPLSRGDGVVLEVGDFMYSCRPSKDEGPCQPTIFFLSADGALVLAKGKSPSSVGKGEELWRSQAPKQRQGGEAEAFTALYSDKGILTVRDAQGKTVWRRRPLFTPRLLRPWPLQK